MYLWLFQNPTESSDDRYETFAFCFDLFGCYILLFLPYFEQIIDSIALLPLLRRDVTVPKAGFQNCNSLAQKFSTLTLR